MHQFESQFEENLYQLRREKLQQIADLVRSQSPDTSDIAAKYPNTFRFTHTIPALRALSDPLTAEQLESPRIEAAIAGRIMAIRVQGKAGFAQLQQDGTQLQLYVRKDDVGETAFALYKLLDLGDHIGVTGYLMRTRTGELTLHVATITFLSKAMLALPDKWSGLEDVETRYRQRYVDLIVNSGTRETTSSSPQKPVLLSERSTAEIKPVILSEGRSPESKDPEGANKPTTAEPFSPTSPAANPRTSVREVFVKRAAILRAIRKFFDARGYLEVETPMLHTIAGGATARTFTTHHNAEDMNLTLRIAPELHLKRLVVGGLDRVYEINRNFRNEGIDRTHNPEFTMLEFYQAYANYHDLIDLTQELIQFVALEVNDTTITTFNDVEIDLSKWTKLSMREAIIKWWEPVWGPTPTNNDFATSISMLDWLGRVDPVVAQLTIEAPSNSQEGSRLTVLLILLRFFVKMIDSGSPHGKYIAELFEFVAEPHLIQPTIIYDFPLAVSPLSKVKPDEPDWVERFEFYIGGFEVGNAFSELNDPDDQLARFEAQLEDRRRGDQEAMAEVDYDYVRALGIGLPPTAGEGIGIDRLTMILTGSRTIRDVMLFPLMRPQKSSPTPDEPHGESAE